jgi:hypothetical protein
LVIHKASRNLRATNIYADDDALIRGSVRHVSFCQLSLGARELQMCGKLTSLPSMLEQRGEWVQVRRLAAWSSAGFGGFSARQGFTKQWAG